MDEVITYEKLYDILRKEKYAQELQKIDKDFFRSVVEYLKEKEAIAESQKGKESIFSAEAESTIKQVSNIKKLIKELYEKREYKIIQLAMFASRIADKEIPSALLTEERPLFLDVVNILNVYRESIVQNVIEKRLPTPGEQPKSIKRDFLDDTKQSDTKVVRFMHAVPKFVANDMNTYGPFDEEDTAILPNKAADVLIDKKRAEEIKLENP
ncbi:DNA replication complex GINS family protein [Candidatus Woesearchaeota archaeon]|nr:DNA replication complex GINS family protein [Candidatus Woesearchaeota archaeon]